MKKYDYLALKAAQVTLRNAAERRGSWWKMFARHAEIANRKLRWIEIGLFFCLILALSGCGTMAGIQSDIHQVTRPTTLERK